MYTERTPSVGMVLVLSKVFFQANEVSDKTVATCFLDNENDVIHTEAVTPLDDYIQSNESTNHQ